MQVEHIVACRNELGEGPVWSSDKQVLYWVDIMAGAYQRFDPATEKVESFKIGTLLGVLAERDRGGLIVATREGFAFWDEPEQKLTYIVRPLKSTERFNDGAVDCMGRFWAGTMEYGGSLPDGGTLYRLDPDGSLHAMITGVGISNGIGWNPENTIMYFTDTTAGFIYAYDFDAVSGDISNQRIFVDANGGQGGPDGLTVDAEGYVWSAFWGGAKVVRYDPQGQVERVIEVPALNATSCVFGGSTLTDLYITSAAVAEADRDAYPLSGDLFRVKTEIKGQPKYKFAG